MDDKKEVIACWGLSNVASLNVWEMKSDESMLVGINNDEPEWCEIVYEPNEDEDELLEDGEFIAGIHFHGSFYRLDHCMRVGR